MVIRIFRRHIIMICVGMLAAVIAVTMAVNCSRSQQISAASSSARNTKNSSDSVLPAEEVLPTQNTSSVSAEGKTEMRAVWVPYMSLNMSRDQDRSEQAFQKKFAAIVKTAKSCGMNTLIVQVRPFGDALYSSAYFPWSHVVSGTQGNDPHYDPLKDMVTAAHRAGMKIHAWVNPLRIQISGTPATLAMNSPCNQFRSNKAKADYVAAFNGGIYYNPAYAEVRKLVADGAQEIVRKYEVDGLQFDDYFYPTQDAAFDKNAYSSYCETARKTGMPLPLGEWRKANINLLVSQVYREIKAVKPGIPFGIAPQGNVQNDNNMGADVCTWCSARGYIDYICPQLYYNFQNPTLPFDRAANTWKSLVKNENIKLYYGLAVYKAGSSADSGTWKTSSTILASQVQYGRAQKCDGFMFYSCDYLTGAQTKQEIQSVVKLLN